MEALRFYCDPDSKTLWNNNTIVKKVESLATVSVKLQFHGAILIFTLIYSNSQKLNLLYYCVVIPLCSQVSIKAEELHN